MAAETLNCPMCGASASTDSTRCLHCGARLATIACPACFGMMFAGTKFCSHCGAKADRSDSKAASKEWLCPACAKPLYPVALGQTRLHECRQCDGLWADVDSLEQICADREKQAAVLAQAASLGNANALSLEKIRYRPCPLCGGLMHRINFAKCSSVVVDVCKGHGTWFDRDELRRIVEFIRAGGLETSRARQLAELESRRRELAAAEQARTTNPLFTDFRDQELNLGISTAAWLLRSFLR